MSSHHLAVKDLPAEGERLDLARVGGLRFLLGAVGVVGLALSAVLFFFFTEEFSYSWLFAFYFCFSIMVGGLFWVLIHHATNSGWGIAVRRVWENLACLIPVMALLFIPFLFPSVQNALWEWLREQREVEAVMGDVVAELGMAEAMHQAVGQDPHKYLLLHKLPYLNLNFFLVRIVFYFVALGGMAFFLRGISKRQDQDGDARWTQKARVASCLFLPFFAVSATFMSIDMLKSLDYTWFSTMWGVYVFAGSAQAAMALSVITIYYLQQNGHLKVVHEEHYHVMGKLLHAFVIFWAYITFSQYFLIWYANMPEETKYFTTRNINDWNIYSMLLWVFRFVIPFAILLFAWLKRTPKFIAAVCGWLLFAHAWDMYHIVIPERAVSLLPAGELGDYPGNHFGLVLMDLVPLVSICALAGFLFLNNLHKHRTYPARDPRLHESLGLTN